MDASWEAHVFLLQLWLVTLPGLHIAAQQFEYCLWFRGSCQRTCGTDTIPLYGSNWCSADRHCCVRIFNPIPDTTTTTTTTTTTPPLPRCGTKGGGRPVWGRIVGGEPASRCEFPWMVYIALKPGDIHPCGGAIIDQWHVLTAAHCFSGVGDHTPEITIGEYNRNEKYQPMEKFTVTDYRLIIHPDYDQQTFFNDIALLQLYTPIDYRRYRCVQPICLPAKGERFPPGTQCVAAGWGVTEPVYNILNPPVSKVLRKVTLPIVEDTLCMTKFGRFYNHTIETCAGQLDGTRDSCDGDSGGPLMCQSGNGSEYYAAGIVSSGVRCAQPRTPAIYTDVSHFLPWIHHVIGSG